MKKIAVFMIFVFLTGCALLEIPDEDDAVVNGVPELEGPELEEEDEEDIEVVLPEDASEEEPVETAPEVLAAGVSFGQVILPSFADVIGEEAYLTLHIPYTYDGPSGGKEAGINKALEDVRVVFSGVNADTTVVSKEIKTSLVTIEYKFPQGPATLLTRIMYGKITPLSDRKRISFLPKQEKTTTATGDIGEDVSDSFIKYGIPEIIEDENGDRRLIIKLEDRYKYPFTIGIAFNGFGVNPEYKEGDLDISFEWLMLANEDATIEWNTLLDYQYVLFYPPYAQKKYVVAFSSEKLKEIRDTIYKKTISPMEGITASIELTTDASGRGALDIGGEEFYIDLKKIVASSKSVIERRDAESITSTTNEIPIRFFVTGNDQGLYFVEYKP